MISVKMNEYTEKWLDNFNMISPVSTQFTIEELNRIYTTVFNVLYFRLRLGGAGDIGLVLRNIFVA